MSSCAFLVSGLSPSICWTGLAPHKLPRALVSLLMYQQPSSTTLYYSYLGILTSIEVRLSNETEEITDITFLLPQRVSFVYIVIS